jgi:hypothetical protein
MLKHFSCALMMITLTLSATANDKTKTEQNDLFSSNNNCPKTEKVTFFNTHKNPINVWLNPINRPAYQRLSFDRSLYALKLEPTSLVDCQTLSLKGVLLKKYGDWSQQHVNGAEFEPSNPVTFSEFKHLRMVLRFDPSITKLPRTEEIKNTYKKYVTSDKLKSLDDGRAHFGLTLYATINTTTDTRPNTKSSTPPSTVHSSKSNSKSNSKPTTISSTKSFNATTLVSFDNDQLDGQWLELKVPFSSFDLYTEQNYKEEPISAKALSNITIEGLRFVAETKSTKVLRNLNPGAFKDPEHLPIEIFKELGFELLGLYLE